MAQHQQYNYTSNFQGQELGDAQLRLNVNGESFDYQPSGPDVEIDIDADLVIDGTITFEEFRTEYFSKDRPVWLKTGGMNQILVPFLGINPDGYFEFARISDDGSSVMWWHLSQDGWTYGTTRIEQTTTFDVADLPGATDPMSDKAFKIATCKLPENVGEFVQCELFLQISLITNRNLAHHDTFRFRIGANKSGADSYDRLVECLYSLQGDGGLDSYLEKLCLSINDGYLNLVVVQKTGVTLSHLVVTAAITNNIGPSKTPWYLTKGIMDRTDIFSGGIQYYFYTDDLLEVTQNKYRDAVVAIDRVHYMTTKALTKFVPTKAFAVSDPYNSAITYKYCKLAEITIVPSASKLYTAVFTANVTLCGDANSHKVCGTLHCLIYQIASNPSIASIWWSDVSDVAGGSTISIKSAHLINNGNKFEIYIELTQALSQAYENIAITVRDNCLISKNLANSILVDQSVFDIGITQWDGHASYIDTVASLPAGTDTEYLFADGTSLHNINQNGIDVGDDVSAPFMYKVSTPTFDYPGEQGFFGLALVAGKSYIAKITLTGETATKAVVVAIDATTNDVRLRYASGDTGIVDYIGNDDPDDTNYLKFFKSDDGSGNNYLTIKCGYVNTYETCTATVELVCLDYSQNSSPIGAGTSLSTGTWPTYAQNRTQKFAVIAVDGPLDQSVTGNTGSNTTAPCTKAVYDFVESVPTGLTLTGNSAVSWVFIGSTSNRGNNGGTSWIAISGAGNVGGVLTCLLVGVAYRGTPSVRVYGLFKNTYQSVDTTIGYTVTDGVVSIYLKLPRYSQVGRIKLLSDDVGHFTFGPISLTTTEPSGITYVGNLYLLNQLDLSTSIATDSASNAKAATPKAVYDYTTTYFRRYPILGRSMSIFQPNNNLASDKWVKLLSLDASSQSGNYKALQIKGIIYYNGQTWYNSSSTVEVPFSCVFNVTNDIQTILISNTLGLPTQNGRFLRISKISSKNWELQLYCKSYSSYSVEISYATNISEILNAVVQSTDLVTDVSSTTNLVYHDTAPDPNDPSKPYNTTYQTPYGIYACVDSMYATKIGDRANHPQIGSPSIPVYVNVNGEVKPCDRNVMGLTALPYNNTGAWYHVCDLSDGDGQRYKSYPIAITLFPRQNLPVRLNLKMPHSSQFTLDYAVSNITLSNSKAGWKVNGDKIEIWYKVSTAGDVPYWKCEAPVNGATPTVTIVGTSQVADPGVTAFTQGVTA